MPGGFGAPTDAIGILIFIIFQPPFSHLKTMSIQQPRIVILGQQRTTEVPRVYLGPSTPIRKWAATGGDNVVLLSKMNIEEWERDSPGAFSLSGPCTENSVSWDPSS